jgi:hypothetical protein
MKLKLELSSFKVAPLSMNSEVLISKLVISPNILYRWILGAILGLPIPIL